MSPDQANSIPLPPNSNPPSMGDPEHLTSFWNILHYTVPIMSADSRDFYVGTGVLVEIEGRLFVATAHHCIHASPFILMDGMELSYQRGVPVPPQPRIRILQSGGDPKIDIGFLELEKGKPIRTQAMHSPCSLDQIHIRPTPVTSPDGGPNPIHVAGWPHYSQVIRGTNISRTLEGFITKYTGRDQTYFYYDFGERATQWNESHGGWEEKLTPSPKGFSGGGCWGIVKSKPDEIYNPSRHIRLLAIQSKWTPRSRVAKAILVAEWLKLLYAHVANLRRCLTARFPDIQF